MIFKGLEADALLIQAEWLCKDSVIERSGQRKMEDGKGFDVAISVGDHFFGFSSAFCALDWLAAFGLSVGLAPPFFLI